MHRLLVHGRHLRLVLHVVHGVHEVLLVPRHPVLHHVLLRVHVVGHLLRLLERRAARHARGRRRRLQLAGCVRWRRLVTVRTVPVLRTHMTHLGRTVRPVTVLLHLRVVTQPVVRWKSRVGHPRRWLGRVVVLRWPELLVAAVHLVPLLRHRAVVRVRLLVLMTTVPHVWHVCVGEVCHVIAAVGAHRGPAARAAHVRIFRCRFSASRADTITVQSPQKHFGFHSLHGHDRSHLRLTRRTVSPHRILGES